MTTGNNPLERLDDLIIQGLKLWQRTDQFCFSIDAVLLAHFAKVKGCHHYVDLGTGTGVIPLLLTALGANSVKGFELNPITADLAKRNVIMNHLEDKISIEEGDYRKVEDKALWGHFDGVFVNPPYQEVGRGDMRAKADVSLALHEVETTLTEVVLAAKRLLRYGGKLWMVHAAHRLPDILVALREHNIEAKRLRLVHSTRGREARLVLVEAQFGAKPNLRIEAPLYIYEDTQKGIYTEEVLAYYRK